MEDIIEIPKSERYLEASKEFSDFLLSLPLDNKTHNELVAKLATYNSLVRKDAFSLGVVFALEGAEKPPHTNN